MGTVIDRQQQRTITLSRERTLPSKLESWSWGKVPRTIQGRNRVRERSSEQPSGEVRTRLMRGRRSGSEVGDRR